jgi:hypothetical protein
MNAPDSVLPAAKAEVSPPGRTKRTHGGPRYKAKTKAGKCAHCDGTGEVREQGRYAVRCPVCLGSRLAHLTVNRQLMAFVYGRDN